VLNYYEVFGDLHTDNQIGKWHELARLIENSVMESGIQTKFIVIIEAQKSYEYYKNLIEENPKVISILVMVEQPSVNPSQHKRKLRELFDHVFVSSFDLAEDYSAQYYNFPLTLQPLQEIIKIPKNKKIIFGLIATSKNSLVTSSLYWLRPSIISFLNRSDQILFAGRDFQSKFISNLRMDFNYCFYLIKNQVRPNLFRFRLRRLRYKGENYLGEILTKDQIFSRVDVVLCLENNIYEFSEKFIDAACAGKLPFYVGPNLDQLGIPESVYIKGSTSLRELRKIFIGVNAELINSKLDNLAVWRINGMDKWKEEVAFGELANKITSLTGSPSHPKT
jgi:hypothetical protein